MSTATEVKQNENWIRAASPEQIADAFIRYTVAQCEDDAHLYVGGHYMATDSPAQIEDRVRRARAELVKLLHIRAVGEAFDKLEV